jgi:hypothetical protein
MLNVNTGKYEEGGKKITKYPRYKKSAMEMSEMRPTLRGALS